jgi:hypothetical protein
MPHNLRFDDEVEKSLLILQGVEIHLACGGRHLMTLQLA